MQKEIKLLERSKKLFEKKLDKENGVKKPKKEIVDENEDWIQHAIKRPGALHRALDVPQDEDIPKWKMDDAEDKLEDEVKSIL